LRSEPPKNVILLVGDGMGFEQTKAAGMYARGSPGTLLFEAFPYRAEMTTYSADSPVTDSAAAATAVATGRKVENGVISQAHPGEGGELETLLEYFKERGRSTGLVTTTDMAHATPAAFGAHVSSRDDTSGIVGDYLARTRPNVLFGGGIGEMPAKLAEEADYTVVTDRDSMRNLPPEAGTFICGRFGDDHLPYEHDGLWELPHLSEMTATALDLLSGNPEGRSVLETIEFSNTVRVALDWARRRPDTLILVTADHETGGLKVLRNNGRGNLPTVSWSTEGHTEVSVPVYALGAGASSVYGTMDNTDLFDVTTRCEAHPTESGTG
jgi:alkaline phosphatase